MCEQQSGSLRGSHCCMMMVCEIWMSFEPQSEIPGSSTSCINNDIFIAFGEHKSYVAPTVLRPLKVCTDEVITYARFLCLGTESASQFTVGKWCKIRQEMEFRAFKRISSFFFNLIFYVTAMMVHARSMIFSKLLWIGAHTPGGGGVIVCKGVRPNVDMKVWLRH